MLRWHRATQYIRKLCAGYLLSVRKGAFWEVWVRPESTGNTAVSSVTANNGLMAACTGIKQGRRSLRRDFGSLSDVVSYAPR